MLAEPFFRFDETKILPHQSHRELPGDDEDGNVYLEAEKEARVNQRAAFKTGALRQIDCLDNLWDSDPEGRPENWKDSSKSHKIHKNVAARALGKEKARQNITPPPTQQASGSANGG